MADAFTVYASSEREAEPAAKDYEQLGGYSSGLILVIDMTAVEDVGTTVTFKVQGVDDTSGKTWDLLVSSAIGSVSTTVLQLHPAVNQKLLPKKFRILADHSHVGASQSFTYSVSAQLVD